MTDTERLDWLDEQGACEIRKMGTTATYWLCGVGNRYDQCGPTLRAAIDAAAQATGREYERLKTALLEATLAANGIGSPVDEALVSEQGAAAEQALDDYVVALLAGTPERAPEPTLTDYMRGWRDAMHEYTRSFPQPASAPSPAATPRETGEPMTDAEYHAAQGNWRRAAQEIEEAAAADYEQRRVASNEAWRAAQGEVTP